MLYIFLNLNLLLSIHFISGNFSEKYIIYIYIIYFSEKKNIFVWMRKWQPTPVFLPGEFHGQRSLQATVHGVAKSWTWLSTSTHIFVNERTKLKRSYIFFLDKGLMLIFCHTFFFVLVWHTKVINLACIYSIWFPFTTF